MRLLELVLRDFRLYGEASFRPCDGITVLAGDNAQGKTAVLEAVQLCCTGRSHRTMHDAEMIRSGSPAALLQAECERSDGRHTVQMTLSRSDGRTLAVNGKTCSRSGELMGHMLGVLFSPEDLRLVKDGPAERRRFVDMELSQLKPSYYYALQRYNRALRQRGELLHGDYVDREQLDLWDGILAKEGAGIMAERASFLQVLSGYAREAGREVSGGKEDLAVSYAPSIGEDASEEGILAFLRAGRETDIRRGMTMHGPHRDDVRMCIGEMDVRAYGSQGQQRTAALAMKLAEMQVMHAIGGEWPVLMLDDVMSELDPGRRRKLLAHLPGVQTIVTCTDAEDLAGAEIGLMVRVQAGTLSGGAQRQETPEELPDFLRD